MAGRDSMGRFTANPLMGAQLMADPLTREVVLGYVRTAVSIAKAAHPGHRGRDARALDVLDIPGHTPAMVTYSSFWHWTEFGTVHEAAYAPMRRGVEGSGCKYVDVGRGSVVPL